MFWLWRHALAGKFLLTVRIANHRSLRLNGRAYDPAEYAHLNVSAEIKDLFQYIGRYKAHEVDLDTSLRCFVPDFIPAVGDMDAFLKVPRPDSSSDELGFKASVYRGQGWLMI